MEGGGGPGSAGVIARPRDARHSWLLALPRGRLGGSGAQRAFCPCHTQPLHSSGPQGQQVTEALLSGQYRGHTAASPHAGVSADPESWLPLAAREAWAGGGGCAGLVGQRLGPSGRLCVGAG